MHVSAIVVAAGKGERLRSKVSKPLVCVRSLPIIVYSLLRLSRIPSIKQIIVVANSGNKDKILALVAKYKIRKVSAVTNGGRRRQDSVANGLGLVDCDADLVLIHDSARPFIRESVILASIAAAKKSGSAIVGVPVKATIKEAASRSLVVSRTLDRQRIWEIQTPQVFKKDLIMKAYGRYKGMDFTDDASLVEKLGAKVSLVQGSYDNIKITSPEDLDIAEAISKKYGV